MSLTGNNGLSDLLFLAVKCSYWVALELNGLECNSALEIALISEKTAAWSEPWVPFQALPSPEQLCLDVDPFLGVPRS
jgi:hypothetical protein